MHPSFHELIKERLSSLLGGPAGTWDFAPVSGGSISEAFIAGNGKEKVFCKVNESRTFPGLFAREMKGLELIRDQKIIRVPKVFACVEHDPWQALVLEWIPTGQPGEKFWDRFGSQLARLHGIKAPVFGWDENNYMGSVTQDNAQMEDWPSFFREKRLKPLVEKCRENNLLPAEDIVLFERLYEKLPHYFQDRLVPSLQHGDLWSGNFMCSEHDEPVLIDPAVYFGHPSVDLGMTMLFGGFSPRFYEAYRYHSSYTAYNRDQCTIANLYPLLIHLYLFGRSYLAQILSCLKQFA